MTDQAPKQVFTANEKLAILKEVLDALHAAIKDSGPNGIPSGHLYAMVMGHLDLDTYNKFIQALKDAGKITESGFVLRAK